MESEQDEVTQSQLKNEIDEFKPSSSGAVLFPSQNKMAHIKNKHVRNQKYQKIKRELKKVGVGSPKQSNL